jgi:hypothetical protein
MSDQLSRIAADGSQSFRSGSCRRWLPSAPGSAAVSEVIETLRSGLGDDSALVEVIIQQMAALTER